MFKQLLVPLDRSPLSEQALGQAGAIAEASHAAVDLVLVHDTFPFDGYPDSTWSGENWQVEHGYIERMAAELAAGASARVTHAALDGEPVDAICHRAWDIDADLIVMGTHGRTGLTRAWLGSVADGVLRHSALPVLVVREAQTADGRAAARHLPARIVVPIDGSELAESVVAPVMSLAACSGAQVTLLRVVQPAALVPAAFGVLPVQPSVLLDDPVNARLVEDAQEQLDELARRARERQGADVAAEVVFADAVAPAVTDFARAHDVDLVAMSTRGRGASRIFVGSLADRLLRACDLPMLLLRPIAPGEPRRGESAATAGEAVTSR